MLGIPPGHDRCSRAREWASLRLDGELSELERLFLRRHLSRCADCRAFAASVATTTRMVREAPQELPSRPLLPLPARVRTPFRERVSFRLRAVAVAGLVVIAGGAGVAVGTIVDGDGATSPPGSGPSVIADLQPENVPIRPRPVGRTANV